VLGQSEPLYMKTESETQYGRNEQWLNCEIVYNEGESTINNMMEKR